MPAPICNMLLLCTKELDIYNFEVILYIADSSSENKNILRDIYIRYWQFYYMILLQIIPFSRLWI